MNQEYLSDEICEDRIPESGNDALSFENMGQTIGVSCPVCQCEVMSEEEYGNCPACDTVHHLDCWEDNEGCGVYGCEHVQSTKKLKDIEIPVSYWGQERKPCPNCKGDIQAAATRCRNCGATFPSQEPMSTPEFRKYQRRLERQPWIERITVAIMICCCLPILAPVGLVVMLLWWLVARKDIRYLKALHRALIKIGIGVAMIQIMLYALIAVILMVLNLTGAE